MEDILAIVEENYELRQPITDGPLESAALTAVSETAAIRRASSRCSRLLGAKPPSNAKEALIG
jgi:hypothetical protein